MTRLERLLTCFTPDEAAQIIAESDSAAEQAPPLTQEQADAIQAIFRGNQVQPRRKDAA